MGNYGNKKILSEKNGEKREILPCKLPQNGHFVKFYIFFFAKKNFVQIKKKYKKIYI